MIQIKDIDFRYPGSKHLVFRDFSLELKENNIYGLLGKNGTGKSTLLYLISGLLRQQQGTILVDGISAQERKAEMLKDIFMVPEEFELPNVSLATYVKMNQEFYPNFSQEVLDRCLKDFDLPLSLKLNELSMGQKKKVFMSFALATGTRFLLMDEPTNGLDIPSKSQFRKVIANNMTEDRTLIISTHQVHDVESLLDHIIIMNQSQLLLDASVSDICEKYTFEYRNPQEMDDTVLYAEPTLQGNAAICKRQEGEQETQMNLELLFWAAQATGDSTFYDIAVKHADTTLKNHFRADNSLYHGLNYNPKTGTIKHYQGGQGFSEKSAWARGQAWGLYGYTMMYRFTKKPEYLEQAIKIAEFVLNHSNMPKDLIPYWDYNAPDIPDALRDASAAAINCSGLLELSQYVSGDKAKKYYKAAEKMLQTLSSPVYTAEVGTNGGFILKPILRLMKIKSVGGK